MVREAIALRKTTDGSNIWNEVPAVTENILNMDLVWKPVGFVRNSAFDYMSRRCNHVNRPFAYPHYENIGILSTKSGLVKTLRSYYDKDLFFKDSGYSLEHTMALSFIVPSSEYMDSPEVNIVRKAFHRIEKQNYFDMKIAAR